MHGPGARLEHGAKGGVGQRQRKLTREEKGMHARGRAAAEKHGQHAAEVLALQALRAGQQRRGRAQALQRVCKRAALRQLTWCAGSGPTSQRTTWQQHSAPVLLCWANQGWTQMTALLEPRKTVLSRSREAAFSCRGAEGQNVCLKRHKEPAAPPTQPRQAVQFQQPCIEEAAH